MGITAGSDHHHHHHHRFLLSFHLHLHHHHHHHHHHQKSKEEGSNIMKKDYNYGITDADVPKGYMAVMVGDEEQIKRRFLIPVIYIYHPLFMDLLKEAEEEYGFHHPGPINIPCNLQHFAHLQGLINNDNFFHHHYHHHHHHICCFKP